MTTQTAFNVRPRSWTPVTGNAPRCGTIRDADGVPHGGGACSNTATYRGRVRHSSSKRYLYLCRRCRPR